MSGTQEERSTVLTGANADRVKALLERQQGDTFFTQKAIDVTFKLGQGAFGEQGYDTLTLRGLRVSADIAKVGSIVTFSSGQIRVWGMSMDHMNKLSTLGMRLRTPDLRSSDVEIDVGDADSDERHTVFIGQVLQAWGDFASMPDVAFNVQANTGGLMAVKPVPPRSYKGSVDVATVMADIAKQNNLTFENKTELHVNVVDQYLHGTARDHIVTLAKAARINAMIDDKTLAIWPKGQSRSNSGDIPLISAKTGMVGYPTYHAFGIYVRTIFNPAITCASRVRVESTLRGASKTWSIAQINYNLAAQFPRGPWFMTLMCFDLAEGPPPMGFV